MVQQATLTATNLLYTLSHLHISQSTHSHNVVRFRQDAAKLNSVLDRETYLQVVFLPMDYECSISSLTCRYRTEVVFRYYKKGTRMRSNPNKRKSDWPYLRNQDTPEILML